MQRHFLLVPAAGKGQRFGAPIPKQYLELHGLPIIEQTLRRLTALVDFSVISVGLAEADPGWTSEVEWRRVKGGSSRAETVLALLNSLSTEAADDDWIWVHDAVRPLLSTPVIERLFASLEREPDCVLAALPVVDTLKQVDSGKCVEQTLDRGYIWAAQTPQVCRYGLLREALQSALASGQSVTDEAMAMEIAGHRVEVVLGSEENIKITRPGDLRLAEFLCAQQKD